MNHFSLTCGSERLHGSIFKCN